LTSQIFISWNIASANKLILQIIIFARIYTLKNYFPQRKIIFWEIPSISTMFTWTLARHNFQLQVVYVYLISFTWFDNDHTPLTDLCHGNKVHHDVESNIIHARMHEATEASIFFPSEKRVPPKEFLLYRDFLLIEDLFYYTATWPRARWSYILIITTISYN